MECTISTWKAKKNNKLLILLLESVPGGTNSMTKA
jgi:hypothetical protein